MIWVFSLLACRCTSDTSPTRPASPVPSVDRRTVQGATCYRGDDGAVLELVVSASRTSRAVFTPAGGEPTVLEGRRAGRTLAFDGLEVELLGRSVAVTRDGERTLLEATGCP